MVLKIKKNIGAASASAEVVEGHLVLSLLNANDPKIWRMPLDKIGAASFELKHNPDAAITKLVLIPKKGTAEIIAEFNDKDEAFTALSLAANALQENPKHKNKIFKEASEAKNEKQPLSSPPSKEGARWMIVLAGLFIVIGLYYYLTTLMPEKNIGLKQSSDYSSSSVTPSQESTGVPVSADDYLSGVQ